MIDRELPVAVAEEAFDADGRLVVHDQLLELDGILVELLAESARHAGPDGVHTDPRRQGRDADSAVAVRS